MVKNYSLHKNQEITVEDMEINDHGADGLLVLDADDFASLMVSLLQKNNTVPHYSEMSDDENVFEKPNFK